MINALFFVVLTLFLLIIQTIILPMSGFFIQTFDLMIIVILFLSLVIAHLSVLLVIAGIGIIMDSLSGAPFGYYLFSYLWLYTIVSLFRQFFFQKSVAFLMVVSIASVLIQQLMFLFSVFITSSDTSPFHFDVSYFIPQLFWAFIIIPPWIMGLDIIYKQWVKLGNMLKYKWEKAREH